MAVDPLSFLSNESQVDEHEQTSKDVLPEEIEQEAPEPNPDRPRDEQGRFAKDDKGEDKGAPPAPEPDKQQHIPLTALLDEREKRQKLERELEQMRREYVQRQQPAQLPKVPSVLEDEAAYNQHVESMVSQAVVNERLNLSEEMARDKYGNEDVDAALESVRADPRIAQHFMQTRHPYKGLVEWHRQQKLMAEIGNDPAAYRARVEAELRAQIEAQAKPEPSRPKPPPSSLAAAPSTSSNELGTPGSAFDRAFS